MLIERQNIPVVSLPSEEHPAPELGGNVNVRGMDMPQMLTFTAARRRLSEPKPGETQAQAAERAGGEMVPLVLSMCVLAGDGLPVYSVAQWAAFGAQHPERVLSLFEVAIRLSGQAPEAEKKA